jgi:hypothetical protein
MRRGRQRTGRLTSEAVSPAGHCRGLGKRGVPSRSALVGAEGENRAGRGRAAQSAAGKLTSHTREKVVAELRRSRT